MDREVKEVGERLHWSRGACGVTGLHWQAVTVIAVAALAGGRRCRRCTEGAAEVVEARASRSLTTTEGSARHWATPTTSRS